MGEEEEICPVMNCSPQSCANIVVDVIMSVVTVVSIFL